MFGCLTWISILLSFFIFSSFYCYHNFFFLLLLFLLCVIIVIVVTIIIMMIIIYISFTLNLLYFVIYLSFINIITITITILIAVKIMIAIVFHNFSMVFYLFICLMFFDDGLQCQIYHRFCYAKDSFAYIMKGSFLIVVRGINRIYLFYPIFSFIFCILTNEILEVNLTLILHWFRFFSKQRRTTSAQPLPAAALFLGVVTQVGLHPLHSAGTSSRYQTGIR